MLSQHSRKKLIEDKERFKKHGVSLSSESNVSDFFCEVFIYGCAEHKEP
jgi:hypothetical protein